MPTNITLGNSAQFAVQFLSTSGTAVSASSAAITLVYNISGVSNSSTIDMTLSGPFWTATWSSVGVDLGLVAWSVASSATTNPAQTGYLRVIDP